MKPPLRALHHSSEGLGLSPSSAPHSSFQPTHALGGSQQAMAQMLEPLPSRWKSQMGFQAPGFCPAQQENKTWKCSAPNTHTFPLDLCFSAFQINQQLLNFFLFESQSDRSRIDNDGYIKGQINVPSSGSLPKHLGVGQAEVRVWKPQLGSPVAGKSLWMWLSLTASEVY